ncbi:hypothetical protein BFL38_05180 [Brachyspira hampsonii]|uniref:Translocation/assembly module TamB n=1 Tax=Brachyspira hampsonii TaxID=1287055 RepID=A0A1E5NDI8_9SPIR|nr:hypothetical protein [Brachyspira hampsonii]OEJ14205.1 hypothetical protein BFL38_05180 [Brachyspira hampsonii]
MIPALFSVSIVISNKQKYLDNVIEYINKISPINIYISDISISYKLELVLDDVKLYSKNNPKAFFEMDRASLRFNIFRIFIKRDPLYILSDVNINDAVFYPILMDMSIFQNNNNTNKTSLEDIRKIVDSISPIFMDKNISINNFSTRIIEDNNNITEVSLNSLNGNFRNYGYFLSYDINLPDSTLIHFSLESKTNLSEINSKIYAEDEHGDLFDYTLFLTNEYNILGANLQNENKNNLLNFKYDFDNKDIDFSITNVKVKKDTIYKIMNIVLDTPIIYKFVKLDNKTISTISNSINTFRDAKIEADGYYSIEEKEKSHINFDLNVRDKLFNVMVNAELTNNNIILSNAYINILEGDIIASGIVPLNDPVSSILSLDVNNVKAGANYLSTKVYLKPVNVDDNEIRSRFTISSLSYANTMQNPMTFEFLYKRPEKEISLNLIENIYGQPFYASYSLDNSSPVLASARGVVPQDIFVVFLGQNIIDNLSSLNIEYTMSNAMYTGGKGNVHVLKASSKKIYTEEYLIRIGASAYKNIIDINDIYYRLSEDSGINANAKIEYDKNFNVKINGGINTPAGNYGLNGFSTTSTNGSKIIYASTDNSEIIANGVIATNGILDLNIKTPKTLSIKDIDINVDVNINNYMRQPLYLYGNVKANKNLAPIFALNTQFELSNESIMFTNIILNYGENRVTGDGILNSTDGITKFAALLKDLENNGIFAIDTSINKNNIYGTITVNQLPFDISGQAYGVLTANATVIGLMNNPVIYLEKFDIKDFQIPGMQFDVSLNGYYRANELEIKDVLITKTGDFGTLNSKPFAKKQQIKIPYAYFSKELQNMTVEVNNMSFMSSFSGTINYNMRKLPDGKEEYRLQTGPITINKRKLPEFGTTVIKYENDILLTNTKNHGIKGSIISEDGNKRTDLVYIYNNDDMLNIDGVIKNTKKDQVDLLVTSDIINVEIFEIFNILFTEIVSSPTNFTVDGKPYTLYARIHGDADNVAIDGRFLGHGKRVKISYFNDIFDDTIVDFSFNGNMFNVNNLTFTSKNKKNLTVTGEAEIFKNNINYMAFDLLSSDEQLGLLDGNLNLGIAKVKGPVHVDLTVGGNMEAPRIGGILTLMKSDVQLSTLPSGSTYRERVYGILSKIYWDFTIEAWRQVRVAHNLVGDVYLEEGSKMRVYNTLLNGIELAGTINVERGSIYYLQNVYQLERGSVTFPSVNSLDPIIEATAYTYKKYYPSTVNTSSQSFENELAGESVTLYMEMNARLSQLISSQNGALRPVRFYTIPALGQYQVNQLAGIPQGTFGSREDQMFADSTANRSSVNSSYQLQQLTMNYSDLLLRSTVLRPVERWFRQFLGIDYINLSPTVVNNLLLFATNTSSINSTSVWDNTSVGIGKYVSKYLYLKYDVTYRVNDTTRPSINGRNIDPYYFDHQFGFEVSLLKNYKLANFVFEYKINPFDIRGKGQDFNIVTRWRF